MLFEGSRNLQDVIVTAIAAAQSSIGSIQAVETAMESAASLLPNREYSRQRAAVIAANPSLQERELLKFATLAGAIAGVLRQRGVADLVAGLAAETGVTVFKIGFQTCIGDESTQDLAQCIRQALDELKALTASA